MAVQINIIEVSPIGEEALQVAVVEGINLLGQQFITLTDTPSTYGFAQSLVKMNATGDGLDYIVSGAAITIDNTSIRFDVDILPVATTTTPASIIPISTNGVIESISFEDAVGDIVSLQTFTSLTDTPSSYTSPFELVKINAAGDGLDYISAGDGVVIDNTSIRLAPAGDGIIVDGTGINLAPAGDGVVIDNTSIRLAPAGDGIIVDGTGINLAPAGDGMSINNTSIRMNLDNLTPSSGIFSDTIIATSSNGAHRSVILEDVINSYTNFLNLSDTPATFGSAHSLVKMNPAGDGLNYTVAGDGMVIDNASIRMDLTNLTPSTSTNTSIVAISTAGVNNSVVLEDVIKKYTDVIDTYTEPLGNKNVYMRRSMVKSPDPSVIFPPASGITGDYGSNVEIVWGLWSGNGTQNVVISDTSGLSWASNTVELRYDIENTSLFTQDNETVYIVDQSGVNHWLKVADTSSLTSTLTVNTLAVQVDFGIFAELGITSILQMGLQDIVGVFGEKNAEDVNGTIKTQHEAKRTWNTTTNLTGVVYMNDTAGDIEVHMSFRVSSGSVMLVYIDSILFSEIGATASTVDLISVSESFTVGRGSTYQFVKDDAGGNINTINWMEYR